MACCGDSATTKQNKQINRELEDEKRRVRNNVKILLLGPRVYLTSGAGESGKSTVAKQMKIIHLDGFSENERQGWKPIINKNIIYSMRILVKKSGEFGYALAPHNAVTCRPYNQVYAERIMNKMDPSFGGADPLIRDTDAVVIRSLWQDPSIQATYQRASEYQLNDSANYFFNHIDTIAAPGYTPSEQDVLRARVRTSGIIETNFVLENFHFSIIDVGGQRSERRKWIHCFQDVTAVLYCVALSGYDQKLFEDETVNRMHESLQLFKDIVNGEWFVNTAMILFLNKRDLFEKKIQRVPLTVCFEDYRGDNSYEDAWKFIERKFLDQNNDKSRQIYTHVTCATDTDHIRFVFNAVKTIILKNILSDLDLYS